MLSVSVKTILRAAIALLTSMTLYVLAAGAWTSWNQWMMAERMVSVSQTTAQLFTALHNLRLDRSQTNRALLGDLVLSEMPKVTRDIRSEWRPAVTSALEIMSSIPLPNRDKVIETLREATQRTIQLQNEADLEVRKPKAERRPALVKDFMAAATDSINALDMTSKALADHIKLQDPLIEKLLDIKKFAWGARTSSGEATLIATNGIAGVGFAKDAMAKYANYIGMTMVICWMPRK